MTKANWLSERMRKVVTIKELLKNGVKPLEVAKQLKVSHQMVYKWRTKDLNQPRKQRLSKIKNIHIKKMRSWAENKYTGINKASSRKIAEKLNLMFRHENKNKLNVSHVTVNNALNKILSTKSILLDSRSKTKAARFLPLRFREETYR